MTARDLCVNFGANSTGFTSGVAKVKSELLTLNGEFEKNKQVMRTVSSEITAMQAKMKSYATGAGPKTASETAEYAKMQDELEKLNLKKAQFKTIEQDLRGKISSSTAELKKQNAELGGMPDKAAKATHSIGGLATALKALFLGYTGKKLYESLIGSNAEMEQYLTSFEVMLGSAEKAKGLMSNLTDFASKTPLELTDSVKSAQLLMNYGVAEDNVISKMRQLGDLSLGNADKLNRVSLAYGQMLAKGKVTGEELRQMTEAGVPLLQALADSIGVSTAALGKMIEKGQVGIPELDKAIESLTTGNGKFAGMMDKQAETMNGMLSTLKDNIAQAGRDIGEGAFVEVKGTISDLLDTIKQAGKDGSLDDFAKGLGTSIAAIIKTIKGAISIIWNFKEAIAAGAIAITSLKTIANVQSALEKFRKANELATISQAALNAVMNAAPYMIIVAAIMGIVGGMSAWIHATENQKKKVEELSTAHENTLSELSEINEELATAASRMDTLNGKKSLTFVEKEELEKLKGINEQLEYKKSLKEELAKAEEKKLEYEAVNLFGKQKSDINGDMQSYKEQLESIAQLEKIAAEHKSRGEEQKYKYDRENLEGMREILNTTKSALLTDAIDLEETDKALVGVTENGKTAKVELGEMATKIGELIGIDAPKNLGETAEEVESLGSAAAQTEAEMANFSDTLAAFKESQSLLNDVQKEYVKNGNLTVETLEKIAKQYPELEDAVASYLSGAMSEKTLIGEISAKYFEEEAAYKSYLLQKESDSENFYASAVLNDGIFVNSMFENYGVDLNNCKTYAEAKFKIESQLLKNVSSNWSKYYDTQLNQLKSPSIMTAQEKNEFTDLMSGDSGKQILAYMDARNELEEIANQGIKIDFADKRSGSATGTTGKYDSKNAESLESKEKENEKKQLDEWIKFEQNEYKKSYDERKRIIEETYKANENAIEKELKAEENATSEKIKLIEQEKQAEKDKIQLKIDAIDKEIQERKRLEEDTDSQKEIDALAAKLKYSQMDDFSRAELEKELQRLKDEKSERDWQREKADEKDELNAEKVGIDGKFDGQMDNLKEQLEQAKELAEIKKNMLNEERDRLLENLAIEQEKTNEAYAYIAENFESLAELHEAGITSINEILAISQEQSKEAINSDFTLINVKTAETADHYAKVVKQKVQEAFDYSIAKAHQAIAELQAATGYASSLAAKVKAQASAGGGRTTYNQRSVQSNVNINNPALSQSQIIDIIRSEIY